MRYLNTLQVRLIAAFAIVVVVALGLAASVFVYLHRDEQERRELDRVVAASPAIFGEFSLRIARGESGETIQAFVQDVARQHDVRILLLDPGGVVAEDSARGELEGKQIKVPEAPERRIDGRPLFRSYVSWKPEDGQPGDGLVLLTSNLPTLRLSGVTRPGPGQPPGQARTSAGDNYSLVLAVPEETVTRAWLGLLPGLGLAAAIALPVAILLAVVIARYVTRPIHQLTLASRRMAAGTFDIDVSTSRSDEVGQLARAFTTMAERVGGAQRQMRTLVADVSHDLKTPLTSILGFAQALRSGKAAGDAEVQRMGAVIEDEATRLSARLNDLLYLSEIESGQALLDRDLIDFGRLAQAVAGRMLASGLAEGVTVTVECPSGVEVFADAPKLERAVENLFDNARKFTPAGGNLSVRTRHDGDQAILELSNPAPDLNPAELPRMFERFYRRDRSRSAGSSGSGLGLPIARDIVTLHGGTLEASLDAGTLLFSLRLPAAT